MTKADLIVAVPLVLIIAAAVTKIVVNKVKGKSACGCCTNSQSCKICGKKSD